MMTIRLAHSYFVFVKIVFKRALSHIFRQLFVYLLYIYIQQLRLLMLDFFVYFRDIIYNYDELPSKIHF